MLLILRSPFHKQPSRTQLLHAFTSQNPKYQHSLHFNQIETSENEIRHPLVKEVCRIIQLTSNWTPTLEHELRQLIRTLKPSQLCIVLQNQSDARTALQSFYWTDWLWRYQHHPVVYNTMLEILSKTSLYQGAKCVIRLMTRRRINVDSKAYGYLMISYSRASKWWKALQVFSMMERANVTPDLFVYNVALEVMIKASKLEMAVKMLDRMEVVGVLPDVVTYNCLIKGYCDAGQIRDAVGLMDSMRLKGCGHDKVSYHTLMGFYCKENRVEEICVLMDKMLNESELVPDQVTYNMLIHMLSKQMI
ncbi:putative tetratricopeptide-like helical domain superfamily [Helianthus anomalus]